jgi:hypothetical protein
MPGKINFWFPVERLAATPPVPEAANSTATATATEQNESPKQEAAFVP